jgi:hypothetical protein
MFADSLDQVPEVVRTLVERGRPSINAPQALWLLPRSVTTIRRGCEGASDYPSAKLLGQA